MKRIIPLLLVAGIMMLVPACKEKKQSTDIITTKYVPKRPQAPIKMPLDLRTSEVEWMGANYTVNIERVSVDSLPMVKDETGQEFVDNRITLTIQRSDSTVFFKKSFTKGSFSSYLDESFRRRALLSGMIYHKTEGSELMFAVSVSLPESDDEFIPLELAVNSQGNIAIKRDTTLDTWGEEDSTHKE